ncbi:MAG: hypothetical protein J6C96_00525 [Oscillospiraceae bacterium]|nr:hypothetical protein [Oscillospiraceae bacterium]
MNMIEKVKASASEVRDCVIKKAVPLSISAVAAANALCISASAEEAGGVDISAVTTSMTTSLIDLVTKAAVACAAVVGAGLSIYGIKWAVKTIRGFFSKIAG